MPTIPCRRMGEHVVRQGRPRISGLFFKQTEDPQPRPVPSTLLLQVGTIGPPACLQRIELHPLPWKRRGRLDCRLCCGISTANASRDSSYEKNRRALENAPARHSHGFFLPLFHCIPLSAGIAATYIGRPSCLFSSFVRAASRPLSIGTSPLFPFYPYTRSLSSHAISFLSGIRANWIIRNDRV